MSGRASRAQEESVESIKEVRSILASVKREEEKRKRVCSINSYCAGCPLRMSDDRRGERMLFSLSRPQLYTHTKHGTVQTATVVQARAPPKKGKADDYGESVYLGHTNKATVL